MKKIKLRSMVILALTVISGAALLHTSQNVQHAEERVRALEASIAKTEEDIRALNAEWAFLNAPERLEKLAAQYLDLKAPVPAQDALPVPEKMPPLEEAAPQMPGAFNAGYMKGAP